MKEHMVRTEALVVKAGGLWGRVGDGLLAVALFAGSLLVYVLALAPSVATLFDDSLEFPLVAHELAIAHPTGYPLYVLLGKFFSLGPFPNVAWAVNFLSAVAGALTVALIYLITRQLIQRRLPALLGAVALAASPLFWSQSVIAEVYTLNTAFVAGLLLLALRWARRPLLPVQLFSRLLVAPLQRETLAPPSQGLWLRLPDAVQRVAWGLYTTYRRFFPRVLPRRRLHVHPLLFALVALFGLSLTHHRMVLLLAPALLVFVFLIERRVLGRPALLGPERPGRPRWLQIVGRPVVLLLVCLTIPLLLYLYLPIRGHVGSLDGAYANTWRGFWQWVTASGFNVFLSDNPLARDLSASFYGRLFWRQFGPVGLALAMLGLLGLLRQPKALVLTGLAFLTFVAFAVIYRVPDVEVFFIPAFLLVAIWIGVGLDYASDLLHPRGPSLGLRRLLAACGALLFVAAIFQPLAIAADNYPDVDMSRQWGVHDYGLYLLDQPLPLDSAIVGIQGETTLVRYFQRTADLRPDIEAVAANNEDERQATVRSLLADGRPTFITRPLPGLSDDYALDSVIGMIDVAGELETLLRVATPDYDDPDTPRRVDLAPVPGLQLLGYGVREHHGHWLAWARVRLWWQTPDGHPMRKDWHEPLKMSIRLLDADGRTVTAVDAEPVAGAYPTTAWRPGEVVADAYEVPLPAGTSPGDYAVLVVVYDPDPVTGTERGRVELPPVYLAGNPERPPQRALESSVGETVYALFGDVELLGYSSPDPNLAYRSGDLLPVTLLWQASGQPAGDLQVSFWLEALTSHPLGDEPVGGRFPVNLWLTDQVVRQLLDLRVPDGLEPGTYQLKMRVTRDGQPVPWGRWLIPLGSDLVLGQVQIGHEH